MLVPGANLLAMALGVIGQQQVGWSRYLGMVTTSAGQRVASWAPPVMVAGSLQPMDEKLAQQLGLDWTKDYVTFYATAPIEGLDRGRAGDRLTYGGRTYQVESPTNWLLQDGWQRVVAVRVPDDQRPILSLQPTFLASTAVVSAPALSQETLLAVAFISAGSTVRAPVIAPGSVVAAPPLVVADGIVRPPVVTPGPITIAPTVAANGSTVRPPVVVAGPVEIAPARSESTTTVPMPSVGTLWTPQNNLAGVSAVMDIRNGRTPASGATSSWASQFGSKAASQAIAANQPTYSDTAFGAGRPGLSFDGTDFLGGLAVGASSTSRTIVALASFNATSNRTVLGDASNGGYGFRRNNDRQMQVILSGVASLATDTVTVPDNSPVILSSRFTQASVADFRQNGRPTTNVVPAGNSLPASNTMQIGAAVATQQMSGMIGCVVIADAYVSDADIQRIEGWLAHANGVAALLPSDHPYRNAPPST